MCSPVHERCTDLTSSPFHIGLAPYISLNIIKRQGLRPLRDLTKHFKARAYDGHAATEIIKQKILKNIIIKIF